MFVAQRLAGRFRSCRSSLPLHLSGPSARGARVYPVRLRGGPAARGFDRNRCSAHGARLSLALVSTPGQRRQPDVTKTRITQGDVSYAIFKPAAKGLRSESHRRAHHVSRTPPRTTGVSAARVHSSVRPRGYESCCRDTGGRSRAEFNRARPAETGIFLPFSAGKRAADPPIRRQERQAAAPTVRQAQARTLLWREWGSEFNPKKLGRRRR